MISAFCLDSSLIPAEVLYTKLLTFEVPTSSPNVLVKIFRPISEACCLFFEHQIIFVWVFLALDWLSYIFPMVEVLPPLTSSFLKIEDEKGSMVGCCEDSRVV